MMMMVVVMVTVVSRRQGKGGCRDSGGTRQDISTAVCARGEVIGGVHTWATIHEQRPRHAAKGSIVG